MAKPTKSVLTAVYGERTAAIVGLTDDKLLELVRHAEGAHTAAVGVRERTGREHASALHEDVLLQLYAEVERRHPHVGPDMDTWTETPDTGMSYGEALAYVLEHAQKLAPAAESAGDGGDGGDNAAGEE